MTEIDPELLHELQDAFVIEGKEQLQSLLTCLIKLEACSQEQEKSALAENILYVLHSMKGNSRATGITTVENVCQAFESALLSLRRKNELLKAETADIFHNAVDLLDDLINKAEKGTGDYLPETYPRVIQSLKSLDERQKPLQPAGKEETTKASPLTNSFFPGENSDSGAVTFATGSAEPEKVHDTTANQSQNNAGAADKGSTTRIALWKLDKLLRESEEMLILKQISEQHLEDMRNMKILARFANAESLRLTNMLSANAGHAATDNEVETFARSIRTFCKDFEQTIVSTMRRQQTEQRLCSNMVDGFIDSVKSLLMHEFSSLFTLVPKLVRDLSRELKKEVNLEIFGGEIEIDRRILEELKDPLVHLIRNCLDHGIETPEERIGRGKSPGAILTVGARQIEGGTVQLVVGDDGQGIDIERLKLAAVREGVISPQEAQTMTDIESMELMCRLSVSTRETVTAISGRGIGMAIVRERIQNLGGRVFVQTKPGEGTKFILQLPTKLSTFRGIQVMAAEQTFIIPTLYVYYAGRTLRSDIKQSGSRNIVNINGQLTSVQSLADVLQIRTSKEIKTKANRSYQQLLVLEAGDRRAGFLVDEIMHEQEVLVRGLSYPLCRVSNISGATILGSGQVVPVLNIVDLLGTSSKAVWADEKLSRQLAEERRHWQKLSEEPIYLVYRHLTSLVMLKSLLENEGYVVKTFDSNEAAGKALANRVPLLLLKSAELPETPENGLMSTIRLDERLKDLPVIFFGSENKASGEQYAQQRGGYAYFSKLDFDRKQILQLIEKLTCART